MKHSLYAISPLDGRYQEKTGPLQTICSEFALIRYRIFVEIHWLIHLSNIEAIPEVASLSSETKEKLMHIITNFSLEDAQHVKALEKTTQHDLKAVEYFLREHCQSDTALKPLIPFIHFACTSEDINNLAYGLMLKEAREKVLLPNISLLLQNLGMMAEQYANTPMLAKTHGQAATPTTVGKEIANVFSRLQHQYKLLIEQPILGKINGAVGNFNAHCIAYPDVDWPTLSKQFVEQLSLHYNPHTTQIEPHDYIAEFFHALSRINTILTDFSQDMWGYISQGYFSQKMVDSEVGSSTMPHKVNPIDFENAEGNFGLANALANHLAQKLPRSRFQRDLSDSTVLRNIGTIFGYSIIAFQALHKGLNKVEPNIAVLSNDLNSHWEVLGEAIQTVMRKHGNTDAYEQLKAFTRGKEMNQTLLSDFIKQLNLPPHAMMDLIELTPETYLGLAEVLAKSIYPQA